MADRHEHAADQDGPPLAEHAVGKKPAEDRRAVRKPGIEPENLRGEWLRIEPPEHEFERAPDRRKAKHGLYLSGPQQIFHHVEDNQRGIAEIREAFPGLGREQDGKPARMAEEFADRRWRLRDHWVLTSDP